jgi:hypothetical protein
LILNVRFDELDRPVLNPPSRAADRRQAESGQDESFVVAAVWTLVRPIHSVNSPSTTDDVHPVIGDTGHSAVPNFASLQ